MQDTPLSLSSPTLAIIAAVAQNGAIGSKNSLPWYLPEDLKHFRRLTLNHRIVMGRRTYESLGRPLPERENVVVSRNPDYIAPGCTVVTSLALALTPSQHPPPIFCIGGAALYAQALPFAIELYLTEIQHDFAGDTYFPKFDRENWQEVERERHRLQSGEGYRYDFVVYKRRPRAASEGV